MNNMEVVRVQGAMEPQEDLEVKEGKVLEAMGKVREEKKVGEAMGKVKEGKVLEEMRKVGEAMGKVLKAMEKVGEAMGKVKEEKVGEAMKQELEDQGKLEVVAVPWRMAVEVAPVMEMVVNMDGVGDLPMEELEDPPMEGLGDPPMEGLEDPPMEGLEDPPMKGLEGPRMEGLGGHPMEGAMALVLETLPFKEVADPTESRDLCGGGRDIAQLKDVIMKIHIFVNVKEI